MTLLSSSCYHISTSYFYFNQEPDLTQYRRVKEGKTEALIRLEVVSDGFELV